jgi:DNA transposition AAA+ family ATPase
MISTTQKARIAAEVQKMAAKSSQKKVANEAGVSSALISQMINGNWDLISQDMWKSIQANLHFNFDWANADTTNFQMLRFYLQTAQQESISIAISEDAGRGKTHAYRHFKRNNENVVHLECKNIWTKKTYVKNLLMAAGIQPIGTVQEMVEKLIKHLKTANSPLLIIDQFDKLKDPQMDIFMDLYNDLDGNCGFVLSGVKALRKKILNGVNRDKIGYAELYSRIGRKFISLKPITLKDTKLICHANGVFDGQVVEYIYENCEGDLRRVKRDIEINQKQNLETLNNLEVIDPITISKDLKEMAEA